ncbi:MAG: class I SAM-dependent methyltransferase [Burkholderiales bacterium]
MSARTLQLTERLRAYLLRHAARETPVQRALRASTQRMSHASMQIGPEQGALMALLVRVIGARRCIEIGTFTGYSALTVALALPPRGKIICCDLSEEWTAIARRYWKRARVAHKIDLRLGPARATLDALLASGGAGRYDFAFIDADKAGYAAYYERCLRLLRKGGLIAADNTLWGGAVADPRVRDVDTRALRTFNRRLLRDRRIEIALLPVGDGLTLALKR